MRGVAFKVDTEFHKKVQNRSQSLGMTLQNYVTKLICDDLKINFSDYLENTKFNEDESNYNYEHLPFEFESLRFTENETMSDELKELADMYGISTQDYVNKILDEHFIEDSECDFGIEL